VRLEPLIKETEKDLMINGNRDRKIKRVENKKRKFQGGVSN